MEMVRDSKGWHRGDKLTLDVDFPNLPYLLDEENNVRLSQSNAILRHLGRKYKLDGKTEQEKMRIDLTEQQVQDYWRCIIDLMYSPLSTSETIDVFRKTTAADHLSCLSRFLSDRPFFAGNEISYADFKAYEYLFIMSLLAPQALQQHENLIKFMRRIESLDGVAAFIQSDRHIEWPISAPFAKWGHTNSSPELDPINRKMKEKKTEEAVNA